MLKDKQEKVKVLMWVILFFIGVIILSIVLNEYAPKTNF